MKTSSPALAALLLAGLAHPAPAQTDSIEATSLLGRPLIRPAMSARARAEQSAKFAEARRAFDRTPDNADSIIWLGRRTAYLGRFRDAIAIYTGGLERHPNDARLYRHRGHRYLTIRKLDEAIADFERADQLTRGQPDQVEPDGLPNARGIPTSTLQSNIRYHLGLGYYLKGDFAKALPFYQRDVAAAVNPDMVVASSHWLYMTLRRLGREEEAALVLEPIRADMDIIENGSYHRLLLLYKGLLPQDSLLSQDGAADAVEDATVRYGVANWHFYNGRIDAARQMFQRILTTPQWGAFGYLAAEAELARMAKR